MALHSGKNQTPQNTISLSRKDLHHLALEKSPQTVEDRSKEKLYKRFECISVRANGFKVLEYLNHGEGVKFTIFFQRLN